MDSNATPSKRRPRRPGGGGDVAGIAVALILASRYLGPLLRGVGPGGRHVIVAVLAVTLPTAAGYRYWRQRREERRFEQIRAARARARLKKLDAD